MDIRITPTGSLIWIDDEAAPGEAATPLHRKLQKAFCQSSASGLCLLGSQRPGECPTTAFRFWRDFAALYFSALCHTPDSDDAAPPAIEPCEEELRQLIDTAPPMPGGEYLSLDLLRSLWHDLDVSVRDRIAECGNGLADFLQRHAPKWHKVGRVCFHLAENKGKPDYPFAFLATYTSSVSDAGKLQHLPLGRALTELAGAKNRRALLKLLSPVRLAADRSELIQALLDSKNIYAPLAWTPREAYAFLREATLFEECGLMVRLPDWWKQRPRPRVAVTVGEKRVSRLGADALLDFKADVLFGDEKLSREELEQLLAAETGLVQIRGKWVEADGDRLREALEHWKAVERTADDGLSFIDGMRLLAGAPVDLGEGDDSTGNDDVSWSAVEPGKWLGEILDSLRAPDRLDAAIGTGKSLRATLRSYQETGVRWLDLMTGLGLGACLADDMGLGKTIQVIAHLLLIMKRKAERKAELPETGPSLLILPASLLANWRSEIERFAPSLGALYLHPSQIGKEEITALAQADYRRQVFSKVDVVLTTYGMIRRQKWLAETSWDLIVLDEAQAIKNPASQQTKSIKKLSGRARIALTGTPIENRLGDLWSLFDFLCPGLLGSRKRFGDFVKQLQLGDRADFGPLRRLTSPYILRRLKTDKSIIQDLPEKTELKAFCGLDRRQASLYAKLVEEMAKSLDAQSESIQRRGLVLSYLMKFKQLCNHPAQLTGDGDYDPGRSGKFARLGRLCDEIASRGEKVLVFTQFREITDPIAAFLAERFGKPGGILHGGVPVARRKKLVDEFQRDDGPPFFVLSLKAGGTGLNLTAASHVIHFDRWWNPAVENQATDRAFRIGQTRNVLVHKFVCQGTIEEKIDALIDDKLSLARDVLAGGAETLLTEMDNQSLIDLVSLDIERATV